MIKTKEHCDICNKDFASLETHNRTTTKHGKPDLTDKEITVSELVEAKEMLDNAPTSRTVDIAKLLYDDIVAPLCKAYSLRLLPWNEVNQKVYYGIAEKIQTI